MQSEGNPEDKTGEGPTKRRRKANEDLKAPVEQEDKDVRQQGQDLANVPPNLVTGTVRTPRAARRAAPAAPAGCG